MQKREVLDAVRTRGWWHSRMARRGGIAATVIVVTLIPLVTMSAWAASHHATGSTAAASATATSATSSTNGASLWEHDSTTTVPTAPSVFSLPTTQHSPYIVDPAFQTYYTASAGKTTLGAPLTAALPVRQGWVQFFAAGALLLPVGQMATAQTSNVSELPDEVVRNGLVDSASGVVRLPLLHTLLTTGSELPIGGADSAITYATLRDATRAEAMVPASPTVTVVAPRGPAATATAATTAPTGTTVGAVRTPAAVFVPGGTRGGTVVGHVIPGSVWRYITNPSNAPDGWQVDFGSPLTEALPFTATIAGVPHALLVQVFWRQALLVDMTALVAAGEPTITLLDTGLDYLRTLGPPTVIVPASQQAWGMSDMALLNAPGAGSPLAHLGANYPLTLTGQAVWLGGALWYSAEWRTPKASGTGWAPAQALTFTSPGNTAAYAGFDALSPALAAYLKSLGRNAGVAVYDVTRNVYYTENAGGQFTVASSVKVPIMLTFLSMTESQAREPDGDEMYLLQTMIENSDNDSAQALFDEIGGVGPIEALLRAHGISGFHGDPDAWGWSTISPMAMVQLLTLLHEGKILTAPDRALALNLMENIESDEQTGVGSTAPAGATVAMKDGWVPGPDGLWAMNSSGIVTVGSETYIIAVYSQDQPTLDAGWAITERVCGQVGKLLT